MKVLFLENVVNIGRRGEVKDVKNGFAQNFLLPKKLAIIATAEVLKNREAEVEEQKAKQGDIKQQATATISRLQDATVTVSGRANESQTLYAAITIPIIIKEIKQQLGESVQASQFVGFSALKHIGSHKIKLRLNDSVIDLNINIKPAA